ncbi:fibronectin type III domain-containing protein [uncultured Tenacibaculum sp.]|uniref:fibronectin type III domain-containing protein n=1 Tax=uncultured Tenacibaculum sp. TaxID=174713 RepID=UPI002623C03A|nr:fibronectin type III domain-containing protein [uncultured Tenacibaculum sp.]
MKKELRFLFALFFLLELTFAQQFPVRIVPRVSAPAPVNFYNYADETSLNSPVTVQIFLNDLTVASRQIRLKTYFEGGNINFTSKDFVLGSEPLFIEGGIPLTLTNTQLAPYYKLENIQGISSVVYGRPIPEGSYNFCFEVYDFASGAKLSAKQCATVFIFKNEPPILNFPQNGTNIEPTDFENIAFQWTPRHINVSNVEYEFSLVEIWDNNVNPQTAFLSQAPIYEETTRRTTLIYGPDKPQLLPGKKYAWRVKAKALQGLEEIGLFKNQGFSEIFWFSRTAPCLVPENVSAEAKGTSKINVFWDQDPTVHSEYIIAYREADNPDAHWFTKKTNSSWATIWNLKAGVTYEYKIKGKCTYQYSDYSEPQYITTDMVTNEDANYNCGIVPDAIAISNREPHPGLYIGDQITAGDFKVTLTNITSQSSGVISGNGFVSIPYLNFAKFAVTFNGVLVNSSNQLAEGEIVTLYDPKFGEGASMTVDVNIDIAEAIGGDSTDKDGVKVDFVITEITIDENGALVVTGVDENGDPQEAIIPGNTDVTITDANGDVWSYGEDGKITKGEGAEGGAVTDATTNGVDSDGEYNAITAKGVVVYFKRSGFYHFDKKPEGSYEKLDEHYKSLAYDGGKYHIGYKAISDNKGKDIIQAKVEITDNSIKRDSIIFKTKEGAKVNILRWDDATNTADLELERKFDYADEEIVAVIRSKEDPKKFDIAGSLLVTHLASDKLEPINVTLVPVGINEVNDEVKTRVAEIYAKSGVRLNLQDYKAVSLDEIYEWDKNNDGRLEVGESGMTSYYTSEQKAFKNFIKQKNTYNKKTYYVFVTNVGTTRGTGINGFMPLKSQFGFVFIHDQNNTVEKQAKTMAHELGHGIFGLEHPWEEFSTPKGATDFLMDNGDGTVLNHLDWKKIHAPGIQIYWFQDDEDGELGGLYWLTPDWKVFTVPNTKSIANKVEGDKYVKGSVPGFKIKKDKDNSIYYYAKFNAQGSFEGYYSNKEKKFYDLKTSTLSDNDSIAVFNFNGVCGKNSYYKAKWENVKGQKGKNPIVAENLRSKITLIKCSSQTQQTSNCNSFVALSYDKEEDVSSLDKYQTKLNESLSTALAQIENTSSTETRDKGNFSHLQFINGKDINALEAAKNYEILEDKLHLLAHYTDTYFVVSFLQLESNNTSIPTALLSDMAEKSIIANQAFINGKKVVHLVLSSSNYESIFGVGLFNNDVCYNIGYGQNSSNIVLPSEVEKGDSPFTDIINVFKTIEKPLNLYATVIKSDFSVHTLQKQSKSNVRGFPLINVLSTLKSPYLKLIDKKLRDKKTEVGELKEDASTQEKLEYERKFIKWKKEYDALILEAEDKDAEAIENNNKHYFEKVNGEIQLREVYITNETFDNGLQMEYANFHFDKDENFDFLVSIAYTFDSYGNLDTKKHFYDGEINPNEVIYGMIDAASLFFAPVGLDTVFDFVGLAFATYNKDTGRVLEYSFGVAMFGYAQYGTKLIKSYKLAKLKKADESYEYIIKKAEEELAEGEELLTEIAGKSVQDARNRLRSEGFVVDIIDGVGEISAANHMLVLGGDLGKTTKRLQAIESQTADNVIDIVVHGADNKIIVDGNEVPDIVNIKKWLEDNHPNADKVRLLSCTNLEGAQDFANKLGDKFTVQATDGYIRVHNDGLVTVVPRQPNGSTQWYELGANRQEKVLPENARPRGPDADKLDDVTYADDFLELSTRSIDDINWAELLQNYPDLAKKIEGKFDNLEERGKFIADLFVKKGVKLPKILVRELLFKNIDQITDKHIDAWKILQRSHPDLVKNFDNLDGFSNVLESFNTMKKSMQEEFLRVLSFVDSKKVSSVNKDNLLANNIKNLKDEHIEAWLELAEYDVNAKFNFQDLYDLANKRKKIEVIVLDYGDRNTDLKDLLKLFGFENAADAAKWSGKVNDYNIEALEKLTGEAYEKMKKAYTFEVYVEGKKITYAVKGNDWKGFFKELKEATEHFNGFQSHHIFVIEAIKRSEGYRIWYDRVGHTLMDVNGKRHDGLANLIMLEGYTRKRVGRAERGVHANHDTYNTTLINFFNNRWKKHMNDFDDIDEVMEVFGDEVLRVQEKLQDLLLEKCVIGHRNPSGEWIRTKVDDLINESVLMEMLN